MDKKPELKDRMSYPEMYEAFQAYEPRFEPNPNMVGRFAKKMGYYRTKQVKNGVITYFYAKKL